MAEPTLLLPNPPPCSYRARSAPCPAPHLELLPQCQDRCLGLIPVARAGRGEGATSMSARMGNRTAGSLSSACSLSPVPSSKLSGGTNPPAAEPESLYGSEGEGQAASKEEQNKPEGSWEHRMLMRLHDLPQRLARRECPHHVGPGLIEHRGERLEGGKGCSQIGFQRGGDLTEGGLIRATTDVGTRHLSSRSCRGSERRKDTPISWSIVRSNR
jgi:hypothetical protein